jgi:hypothetical protein
MPKLFQAALFPAVPRSDWNTHFITQLSLSAVQGSLGTAMGPETAGLAALGAVAAHLAQVAIDSLLVPAMTAYVRGAARKV